MALIISDRVKETTTTSGTGTISLGGAVGGFVSFQSAISEGNKTYYVIENDTRWEIGIGTYSSGSLSRDTVLSSSIGGGKISLSGVSFVFVALPSSKTMFKDENGSFNLDADIATDNITVEKYSLLNNVTASGDIISSGLLTLVRTSSGNFFQAYVDDSNKRTLSLHTNASAAPQWKLGLKSNPNDPPSPPTYAYVQAEDGNIGLYGNSSNYLSLSHGAGFTVVNKSDTIFTTASTTGTSIFGNGAAYPTLIVKAAVSQAANIQEWRNSSDSILVKVENDGSLVVNGSDIVADIRTNSSSGVSISGYFEAGGAVSGYLQGVIDAIPDAAAVSGYLQPKITANTSDIATVSGLLGNSEVADFASGLAIQNQLDIVTVSGLLGDSDVANFASGLAVQNEIDITTVSGLLYNDASLSGYFESRVDSTDSDIATVSGLLYDDTAISGYFESRVDSADSSISTNSSSITANSGYFESRVDTNAADIVTVSGLTGGSAGLPLASGAKITANTNLINSVSGWAGSTITNEVASLVDSAPATLNTLNELAAAINDDAGFSTFISNSISANSVSGVAISGIANFASGLAIQNEADIATVSGLLYDDTAVSGYFETRSDANAADIVTVSGLLGSAGSTSGIVFEASGTSSEYRIGTVFIDPDGTEQVVRATDFNGGFLRLEVARFSPSVSAAGQSRNWDQAVTQWTVTVDNPTDFTTNYVSGVKSPLTGITGGVTSNVTLYSTSGPSVTPGGGVDWTQTFSTDGDSPIYSSTNNLTGGSASATVSFLDKNQATISETATITFNWSNASNGISFGNLSGKNFLETYTSTTYNLTINNISDLSNTSTTITSSQGSLSNSSDDGTITFTTPIHKNNNSGRTITATTDFTRPATVTGTEYTSQDVSSDSSISASFTYPSFYIFTASTSNVPSRADVVDTNDFDSSTVTELGDQVKTIDQYINNPDGVPKCWWFGVRSSASQPTSFETGSGPSLLVGATPTEATVDLEPDSPPAGYSSEEYKLYGITLNPGNTYVKIS